MKMEGGEPSPDFFPTYSRKINVNYASIYQGFSKTTTFINAACAIYDLTTKEHGRYL